MGIIVDMGSASDRRHYNVMSLIDGTHTQNDPSYTEPSPRMIPLTLTLMVDLELTMQLYWDMLFIIPWTFYTLLLSADILYVFGGNWSCWYLSI